MAFDNCSQAYAAGRANIPKGDPDYAPKLDRDNDGFGCDNPPPGFKPKAASEKPASGIGKADSGTSTGTKVQQGAAQEMLPKTGPAMDLGIIGAVLFTVGVVGALVSRRRRTRFTA